MVLCFLGYLTSRKQEKYITGLDLFRQFYVQSHWNFKLQIKLLSPSVLVYWHWTASSSVQPKMPGIWQGSHKKATFSIPLHLRHTGLSSPCLATKRLLLQPISFTPNSPLPPSPPIPSPLCLPLPSSPIPSCSKHQNQMQDGYHWDESLGLNLGLPHSRQKPLLYTIKVV